MLLSLTEEAGRRKTAEKLTNETDLSCFNTVWTVTRKYSVIQDPNYPILKMRIKIRGITSLANYYTRSMFDLKVKKEIKVKVKLTVKTSDYETQKISSQEIKQEQSQPTSEQVKLWTLHYDKSKLSLRQKRQWNIAKRENLKHLKKAL